MGRHGRCLFTKRRLEVTDLTGIVFHVDHIIPMKLSGLHMETNLQLLPAHLNQVKKNKFDPQTFCA